MFVCFTVEVHQERVSADRCRTGRVEACSLWTDVRGRRWYCRWTCRVDSFTPTPTRQGALPKRPRFLQELPSAARHIGTEPLVSSSTEHPINTPSAYGRKEKHHVDHPWRQDCFFRCRFFPVFLHFCTTCIFIFLFFKHAWLYCLCYISFHLEWSIYIVYFVYFANKVHLSDLNDFIWLIFLHQE